MRPGRIRLRWHWLPAAVLGAGMVWTRNGAPIALLALGGGLALALHGERRARMRRRDGDAP